MKIKLKKVTVRELVSGYNTDNGVWGYEGKLNIRPEYQREFVYSQKQSVAVINSIRKGLPLNTMYWVANDGTYEVLDGQQRTISIANFVNGDFATQGGVTTHNTFQFFHNLDDIEQGIILDYELMVYVCDGTNDEKLSWFETINMAGEKLTKQELLNAVYSGTWLNSAKRYFSKPNCQAKNIGKQYLKGSPIRQEYLQTVLSWVSDNNIVHYMAEHQNDNDANDLWLYFTSVISWVETYFPNYRKEMKSVQWGILYNEYGNTKIDSVAFEVVIKELMINEDVTKKSGIYSFLLTQNERDLSIRAFNTRQKRETYERQDGKCVYCDTKYDIKDMEADHIIAWSNGGKTIGDNCQMLCKKHNLEKSNK